ncbi:hypothetical protein ACHAXA_007705 [Cyclostephanos tholiformis]|uniref:3'-5' exonuclease domain-containing protein n=1 Tax=Cyclostephanos tholiformis TaxID=382380 RepID=A0ABD3RIN8_9STRA
MILLIVLLAVVINFVLATSTQSSNIGPSERASRTIPTKRVLQWAAAFEPATVATQALRTASHTRKVRVDRTRWCPVPVPLGVTKAVVVARRQGIFRPKSSILEGRLGEYYVDSPVRMEKLTTISANADNRDQQSAVDHICSILRDSIRSIECANEAIDVPRTVQGAIHTLHRLKSRTLSFGTDEAGGVSDDTTDIDKKYPSKGESGNILRELTCDAYTAVGALHELVHRVNLSRRQPNKSSVHAWKALESVVNSTIYAESADDVGDTEASDLSTTLALLAVGLALSMDSTDASVTKMIAGAILPRGHRYLFNRKGTSTVHVIAHAMARAAVLGLLRLAIETVAKSTNDDNCCIDLQIVAKIESGFSVGEFGRMLNIGDEELSKAAADLVASVIHGADTNEHRLLVSKDITAPIFSIIANIRPWNRVRVERLVRIAASIDLWYSAELLCDAAIDTVLSSQPTFATQKGQKQKVATSFSIEQETEPLEAEYSLIPSLPQNSIAHLAAGAIIDVTFDNRLYQRADVFASKYFSFSGPERFAEARFMHACDTIDKVIKRRQVQIIDKQIERVDEMVARLSIDSHKCANRTSWHGEGGATENMSLRIREFSLRRLRAANMHTVAMRLAKLWDMQYKHDPIQIMEELKKRRLTYLQWDDDVCPGGPLPELISDPDDLLMQFNVLTGGETVGFDCEFHESINFVALLQLATTTSCLLIDIPSLTVTKDGCDALRSTVGKMFTRSSDAQRQRVIGFACNEDIKRLRNSPCHTMDHWFPQNDYLHVEDLRNIIAETSPIDGLQHFGLSRACKVFLGKQLDKSEQCSDWLIRPLSPEQREYACLDAYACAAIHSRIMNSQNKMSVEK